MHNSNGDGSDNDEEEVLSDTYASCAKLQELSLATVTNSPQDVDSSALADTQIVFR